MLDIKFVRDHLDEVQKMLENRCNPLKLDGFKELEKKRREILKQSMITRRSANDGTNE